MATTYQSAVQQLLAAGFVLGVTVYASSSTVPVGSVISVSPAAGSVVDYGTPVVLTVSSGPAPVPPSPTVPNVVGLGANAAALAIYAQAGLGLASPVYAISPLPLGTVLGQSPVAGSSVVAGTNVTLTLASTQDVTYPAEGSLTVPVLT